MKTPHNALVIFCRAPRLGQVKTRLAATRGEAFALGLYRAMLLDTFALGHSLAPEVETWVYYTPLDAFDGEAAEDTLAPDWSGPHLPQCSGDLGAKMMHAFRTLRSRGYRNIVQIGSDSPDLPRERVQVAFEILEQPANSYSLVVGPSFDGGFYLLGAGREFPAEVLGDMMWSTDRVYSQLRSKVERVRQQSGEPWELRALHRWRDVDEEADLLALYHRLFQVGTQGPHTREFLRTTMDLD